MQSRRTLNFPGHAHELTFSCYRGYPFLTKNRTRDWLRESIDAARKRWEFDLWAFVVMPEHVHLMVHPRRQDHDVTVMRKAIKEPVAKKAVAYLTENSPEWLERISVRSGAQVRRRFWQKGAGYDRNVYEPKTLSTMIDYIHENPVRRGLCRRAIDWEWSSAAQLIGSGTAPILVDPIPPEWLYGVP
ncbi:REP-associated tyrosine transposase [Stratiformator vulcanicus]|uniref:Transposase IS200 like protein n=1 Tax=Stratiformator vulcanicus TaxID=2527980 RepID=A0A517R2B3_9PLAN|nr:transposase [Stratiformator vulcanicus]QDT38012.1 Transposase IS200 like protein [Stratiformator vulcanicus]